MSLAYFYRKDEDTDGKVPGTTSVDIWTGIRRQALHLTRSCRAYCGMSRHSPSAVMSRSRYPPSSSMRGPQLQLPSSARPRARCPSHRAISR